MSSRDHRGALGARSQALRVVVTGLVFVASALGGCPTEEDANDAPGLPVEFRLSAITPTPSRADGWALSLDRADLAIADPTFYGSVGDSAVAALHRLFRVAPARAHAGHAHGEADAEGGLSGDFVVDLLAEDGASLGDMSLPAALYFDGRLRLATITEGAARYPGSRLVAAGDAAVGHTLLVEGTAVDPDGVSHALRVNLDVEEWVRGLELDLAVGEQETPTLTLVVRLDLLFDALDAETLRDLVGPDGVLELTSASGSAHERAAALLLSPEFFCQQELLH